jgi:hypothetical protein
MLNDFFPACSRKDWQDIVISFDASYSHTQKHTTYTVVLFSGQELSQFCRSQVTRSDKILRESWSYKELRQHDKLRQLEDYLDQAKQLNMVSLSASVDISSARKTNAYIETLLRERLPHHPMSKPKHLSKITIITDLVHSLLLIALPTYNSINLALDNEDFTSNTAEFCSSVNILATNINNITGIGSDNISIGTKRLFDQSTTYLSAVLFADLLAGAFNDTHAEPPPAKIERYNLVANWINQTRSRGSAMHYACRIDLYPPARTVTFADWPPK